MALACPNRNWRRRGGNPTHVWQRLMPRIHSKARSMSNFNCSIKFPFTRPVSVWLLLAYDSCVLITLSAIGLALFPLRIFGTFLPHFRHLKHDGLVLRTHCFSNASAVICILSIGFGVLHFVLSWSSLGTVNVRNATPVRLSNFLGSGAFAGTLKRCAR